MKMSGVTYEDIRKANRTLEITIFKRMPLGSTSCLNHLESAQEVFPEAKGREGYIEAKGQNDYFYAIDEEGYVTDIGLCRIQGYRKAPVGRYQNQWQTPITMYGSNNPDWEEKLKASSFVGDIEVEQIDWFESRQVVDVVMDLLQKELLSQAEKYEGLRINSNVRQGSCREGLKVVKADEFDSMLEFHLEGLDERIEHIYVIDRDLRRFIPGYCYLEIRGVTIELSNKFTRLYKKGVFIELDGKIFLNSKHLHVQIFESMVDSAVEKINTQIKTHDILEMKKKCMFGLKRKINPPSINLAITLKASEQYFNIGPLKRDKGLDLDFVPAFLLRYDQTTSYEGVLLKCPIHAVCKWAEDNSFKALEIADQRRIWVVKSTGYEKHVLDVAREDERKLIILTALRILKTYALLIFLG